jgi:hypothetical protein
MTTKTQQKNSMPNWANAQTNYEAIAQQFIQTDELLLKKSQIIVSVEKLPALCAEFARLKKQLRTDEAAKRYLIQRLAIQRLAIKRSSDTSITNPIHKALIGDHRYPLENAALQKYVDLAWHMMYTSFWNGIKFPEVEVTHAKLL